MLCDCKGWLKSVEGTHREELERVWSYGQQISTTETSDSTSKAYARPTTRTHL
jgi:hypothetical protein